MSVSNIMVDIQIATRIARQESDTLYGYYLRSRAPSPGAQPEGTLSVVSLACRTWHETICDDIWGWVCYARPLTQQEIDQYELLPDEDNPHRYERYGIIRGVSVPRDDGTRTLRQEKVLGEDGKPYISRYKRKALIELERRRKEEPECAFRLIMLVQKETSDGALP